MLADLICESLTNTGLLVGTSAVVTFDHCQFQKMAVVTTNQGGLIRATVRTQAVTGDARSTLLYDTTAVTTRTGIFGFKSKTNRIIPWMAHTGGTFQTPIAATVGARSGWKFEMYFGLTANRLPVAGFGDIWIDPTAFTLAGRGTIGPSGMATIKLTVPKNKSLIGLPLTFQALAGPNASLTNPTTVVLREK